MKMLLKSFLPLQSMPLIPELPDVLLPLHIRSMAQAAQHSTMLVVVDPQSSGTGSSMILPPHMLTHTTAVPSAVSVCQLSAAVLLPLSSI